jgi:hypothetical protein
MAEEFMDRSEAAERHIEALQRDLEIAQAANTLLDEQKQQVRRGGWGDGRDGGSEEGK